MEAKYIVEVPFNPGDRPSVLAVTVAEMQREVEELLSRYGYTVSDDSCVSLVVASVSAE